MPNTEYITMQGDRWDSIAYAAYGDASDFSIIQDANPNVPATDVFDMGVRLIIPIQESQINTNIDSLPPWKRVQTNATEDAQAASDLFNQTTANPESFDKSFD